jgi:glycosyltransferase involved in cell wall biosynthesis
MLHFSILRQGGRRLVRTAVVISTYNSPAALRRALLGFLVQSYTDFELVIADDGSDDRTIRVLEDPLFAPLSIQHVWHEDLGFRLAAIRNRAIASTAADYLIFCDGDCIPRDDFVAQHVAHARPNYFISGSRVNVPAAVHQRFADADITDKKVFDVEFLHWLDPSLKRFRRRLNPHLRYPNLWNWLTYRYCVFSGSNASAWRKDILRVNGFDENFRGYGSEDRDLGIRLRNAGVRSRFLKYSLVQLHLDHPCPYVNPTIRAENRRIFRSRIKNRVTRIELGVDDVLERP